MKRIVLLFVLSAVTSSGCFTWIGTSGKENGGGTTVARSRMTQRIIPGAICSNDYLVGWYKLPRRHYRTREIIPGPGTLIPVLKRGGGCYSVCRGIEVPLKACPEGLEWGFPESSMRGTKIGLDKSSKEPYIIIEDANAQYEGDYSTSGEKQFMTKTNRPAGLLDATSKPPFTNDGFIGCYQPLWFTGFRWIIRKVGGEYRLDGQIAGKDGWQSEKHETAVLEPLQNQLGFAWGRKKEYQLVYNRDLRRIECTIGDGGIIMPLVRVKESQPGGIGTLYPPMAIGIPSWH